jgi:uncharacterized protein
MLKQILAVGMLVLAPLGAGASQLPDYPFIHASGSASVNVMPDIGEIDFEISASDADPELARGIVETRIAEVRALMEQQGVPLEDVQTRDVRKEISKGDPTATLVSYEIKCGVHLNVRDLSKWRAVVAPLLDKPNLDGFSTAFDSSMREKIEMELIGEAIRDARRKAEAMAAGLGRKLGPASAVTSGGLKNLGNSMGLVTADFLRRPEARGPVERRDFLAVSALKLQQPVDVIFRIR